MIRACTPKCRVSARRRGRRTHHVKFIRDVLINDLRDSNRPSAILLISLICLWVKWLYFPIVARNTSMGSGSSTSTVSRYRPLSYSHNGKKLVFTAKRPTSIVFSGGNLQPVGQGE